MWYPKKRKKQDLADDDGDFHKLYFTSYVVVTCKLFHNNKKNLIINYVQF